MRNQTAMTDPTRQGLKNSIYDGAFAQITIVLTSGIFLTGFALALGANEFHIGVLAAIPLMAQLTQLGTSFLMERKGARKKTLLFLATISRYSWIMLFAVLLVHHPRINPLSVWIVVGVCLLAYLSGSAGTVAWLSWMADLVPAKIRGRYFAHRNRILALVGVVVTVAGGYYLDLWKTPNENLEIYGFLTLFALAVICGEISLRFLRRIPALETQPTEAPKVDFFKLLRFPLKDSNFVRLTIFSTLWSFSVSLAAPFFAVYMLTDLKMSYALLALVHIVNEMASILALPLWGRVSDRFGSKPVLWLTTLTTALLPALWLLTVSPHFVLIIVILQLYGGIFWSGLNLNSNNILLKLSPKQHRSVYLATFAAVVGLATAVAPLVGGLLAVQLRDTRLNLGFATVYDLHFIFLMSTALRLLSRVYLRKIVEDREKPVGEMIRVLSRFRTLNVTKGFEPLLNYVYLATTRIADFIEGKDNGENQANQNRFPEKQD